MTESPKLEIRRAATPLLIDKSETTASGLPVLKGVPVVFNQLSEDLGRFYEKFVPGAFDKSLRSGRDVLALYSHETAYLLGRLANKSLRIEPRLDGLHVRIVPPDTSIGRDVVAMVRDGYLRGMSFGFHIKKDEWAVVNGQTIRTVKEATLSEVSIVAVPAYPQTSVSVQAALSPLPSRSKQSNSKRGLSTEDLRRRMKLMEMS